MTDLFNNRDDKDEIVKIIEGIKSDLLYENMPPPPPPPICPPKALIISDNDDIDDEDVEALSAIETIEYLDKKFLLIQGIVNRVLKEHKVKTDDHFKKLQDVEGNSDLADVEVARFAEEMEELMLYFRLRLRSEIKKIEDDEYDRK